MKQLALVFLNMIILAGLVSCQVDLPAPLATSPPEVVKLQITPAVAHWLPRLAECADPIPNFGILTQVLPRGELSLDESDLIIRLGEQLNADPFIAVMGIENLVVIAGNKVPVSSLSQASLQGIYSGKFTDWRDLPEVTAGSEAQEQLIQPLSYPQGHEIEVLFRQIYLHNAPIAVNPQVFSTVNSLERLLSQHPAAIGYLLESQVPDGMRILTITADDPLPTGQFVLAITNEEPQGGLKQLLLCLQNAR